MALKDIVDFDGVAGRARLNAGEFDTDFRYFRQIFIGTPTFQTARGPTWNIGTHSSSGIFWNFQLGDFNLNNGGSAPSQTKLLIVI